MEKQRANLFFRAVNPLLVLSLFCNGEELHQQELTKLLRKRTENKEMDLPYYVFNNLVKDGYIRQTDWRARQEGRYRKFYTITPKGQELYETLKAEYQQLNRYITNAIK